LSTFRLDTVEATADYLPRQLEMSATKSRKHGSTNETVGPAYFNPQAITQGRRAQFGAQFDW